MQHLVIAPLLVPLLSAILLILVRLAAGPLGRGPEWEEVPEATSFCSMRIARRPR